MPECRFDNRVAVITGAGRGLGRSYALLLASKGAKIVVNDNGGSMRGDETGAGPAEDVVREIKAMGGQAVACTESVATPEGGAKIIQTAIDSFGRIDILIHNAGNVRYGSLKDISYEDFRAVVDVHLLGAFHVVRPAFPLMCAAKYGRVVLTSSIGGLYGNANVVNYGVAKAGMVGLNNIIAIEGEAENVKSNIILPGAVTRMSEGIDISQFPAMPPELVAPVVGYLAHESCAVSGEMYASVAGRVARAYVTETKGVFQPSWTIEQVRERLSEIRDPNEQITFQPVPTGFGEHLGYGFEMARKGGKQ